MRLMAAYIMVILIWSTTPLAIQWSSQGTGFVFALTARMVISLCLSYIWMRMEGERLSLTVAAIQVYLASVLGIFGAMLATYWAAQYISSGLISVLFGLSPVVAGVLGWVFLGENFFRLHKIAGVCCGLVGLVIIFYSELAVGSEGWKGVLGMLLGVLLYSSSSVMIKKLGGNYPVAVINTGSLLMAMPCFAVAWIVTGQEWPAVISQRDAAAIIYLGVFGSFIGFMLYYYVLKSLSVGSVMLIPLITPLIALTLGVILNAEVLSVTVCAGALLVLVGLMLYQWLSLSVFFRARFFSK